MNKIIWQLCEEHTPRPGIEVESPECEGFVCWPDLERIARSGRQHFPFKIV